MYTLLLWIQSPIISSSICIWSWNSRMTDYSKALQLEMARMMVKVLFFNHSKVLMFPLEERSVVGEAGVWFEINCRIIKKFKLMWTWNLWRLHDTGWLKLSFSFHIMETRENRAMKKFRNELFSKLYLNGLSWFHLNSNLYVLSLQKVVLSAMQCLQVVKYCLYFAGGHCM